MKPGTNNPVGRKPFPRRGEIYWVALDPTVGREIRKTRPALVVSPDEMNQALGTVVLAPITSTVRDFPTRYTIRLQRKTASVALDQIRTVSVERLLKKMTTINPRPALVILREMFAD
jgi:mRNA interferase MazF